MATEDQDDPMIAEVLKPIHVLVPAALAPVALDQDLAEDGVGRVVREWAGVAGPAPLVATATGRPPERMIGTSREGHRLERMIGTAALVVEDRMSAMHGRALVAMIAGQALVDRRLVGMTVERVGRIDPRGLTGGAATVAATGGSLRDVRAWDGQALVQIALPVPLSAAVIVVRRLGHNEAATAGKPTVIRVVSVVLADSSSAAAGTARDGNMGSRSHGIMAGMDMASA